MVLKNIINLKTEVYLKPDKVKLESVVYLFLFNYLDKNISN